MSCAPDYYYNVKGLLMCGHLIICQRQDFQGLGNNKLIQPGDLGILADQVANHLNIGNISYQTLFILRSDSLALTISKMGHELQS